MPLLSGERQSEKVVAVGSANDFVDGDQMQQQAELTPTRRVPIINKAKKTTFDSADYFMEQSQDKAEAMQKKEEEMSSNMLSVIKHKRLLLSRTTRKRFDSADYFMDQQKSKKSE